VKEMVKIMLIAKLKIAAGMLTLAALAVGFGGLAYQSVGAQDAQKPAAAKPASELEALRREHELLKLNLRVVLEKMQAQETELAALKRKDTDRQLSLDARATYFYAGSRLKLRVPDAFQEAEAALKKLRESPDKAARDLAADALENAVKKLREQPK
jgi:hypothetical protein